jgi:hypothetical protein
MDSWVGALSYEDQEASPEGYDVTGEDPGVRSEVVVRLGSEGIASPHYD